MIFDLPGKLLHSGPARIVLMGFLFVFQVNIQAQDQMPYGYAAYSCSPERDGVTLAIRDIRQAGKLLQNPANRGVDNSEHLPVTKMYRSSEFDGHAIGSIEPNMDTGELFAATYPYFPVARLSRIPPKLYRISSNGSSIDLLATLDGNLGIASIAVNECNNLVYASNFDDGLIYVIDLSLGTQQGITTDYQTFSPYIPEGGAPSVLPPLGKRIWALAFNHAENRLYYFVWGSDYRFVQQPNVVRSVGLNANGKINAADDRLEFEIPFFLDEEGSGPIGDIAFNREGNTMLLAEIDRGTPSHVQHASRSMEYRKVGNHWVAEDISKHALTPDPFKRTTIGVNASGGVSFAFGDVDDFSNPMHREDHTVWSGNFLNGGVSTVYGLQYHSINGGRSENAVLVRNSLGAFKGGFYDVDVRIPFKTRDLELDADNITVCSGTADATITFNVTQGYPTSFTVDFEDDRLTDITIPQGISNTKIDLPANLPEGTYRAKITFYTACGQTVEDTFNLEIAPALNIGSARELVMNDAPCEVFDGIALFKLRDFDSELTQGNPDYEVTYFLSEEDAAAGAPTLPDEYANVSASQTIYAVVTNPAVGCTAMVPIQLTVHSNPIPPLTLTIHETVSPVCSGNPSGSILVAADGGDGNHRYALYLDGEEDQPIAGPQPSGSFMDLNAGNYHIVVQSGDCSTTSMPLVLERPDTPVLDVTFQNPSCHGAPEGQINVDITGGVGPYVFSMNEGPFETLNSFTGLGDGTYSIVGRDANGCVSEPEVITLMAPQTLDMEVEAWAPQCEGEETGAIQITPQGGTPPYKTGLSPSAMEEGRLQYTNLSPGEYTVYITDGNGCNNQRLVEIENPTVPDVRIELIPECSENLFSTILLVEVLSEGTDTLLMALDSGNLSEAVTNVSGTRVDPGSHTLTLFDANGCSTSLPFEVEAYLPLSLNVQRRGLNGISLMAKGGQAPYEFYVNDVSMGGTTSYQLKEDGPYTFTVTDYYGCYQELTLDLEHYDIEIPKHFSPDSDGTRDSWELTNHEDYVALTVRLYDRYGRVVAVLRKNSLSWTGEYKGTPLPSGDYWYLAILESGQKHSFTGHVTLIR